MFCEKCGNQIQNGESFCSVCGNPVIQHTQTPFINNSYVPEVKKSSSVNKKVLIPSIIGVAAVVAILVLCIIHFAGNKPDTEYKNELSTGKTKESTNGATSDFTSDMSAEEFALKLTQLMFSGEYEEAKKYYIIDGGVDYNLLLEDGECLEDLKYVLEREECVERLNNGVKYDVVYELYDTNKYSISDTPFPNMNERLNSDVDYSKITEAYVIEFNIDVIFDDGYKDGGMSQVLVLKYGDSWRCFICYIDM